MTPKQIVKLFIYLEFVKNATGFQQRDKNDRAMLLDRFEFGRAVPRELEDIIDAERVLEDSLEVDKYISLSMSMSVAPWANSDHSFSPSMSPSEVSSNNSAAPTARISPTPSSATVVSEKEATLSCTGPPTMHVTIILEVDLAAGKTEFLEDLSKALINALTVSFPLCSTGRRYMMAEHAVLQMGIRGLVEGKDEIYLSGITTEETGQSCIPQSIDASSCRLARVDIQAFGNADARVALLSALDSTTTESASFKDELTTQGIIGVRIKETGSGSNFDASNTSYRGSSSGSLNSSQTVMAIVLSTAALVLVIAVVLRRGAMRRKRLGYIHTVEEQYATSHCLGIQPLDYLENASNDSDTYYSRKLPYASSASF